MTAALDLAPLPEQFMDPDRLVELWQSALGAELKAQRKATGLKQADMAERLGMSSSALSKLERGLNTILGNYIRYAHALGIEEVVLFTAADLAVKAAKMRPTPALVDDDDGNDGGDEDN